MTEDRLTGRQVQALFDWLGVPSIEVCEPLATYAELLRVQERDELLRTEFVEELVSGHEAEPMTGDALEALVLMACEVYAASRVEIERHLAVGR